MALTGQNSSIFGFIFNPLWLEVPTFSARILIGWVVSVAFLDKTLQARVVTGVSPYRGNDHLSRRPELQEAAMRKGGTSTTAAERSGNPTLTLGVEEEFLLLDRSDGCPVDRAPAILTLLGGDPRGQV